MTQKRTRLAVIGIVLLLGGLLLPIGAASITAAETDSILFSEEEDVPPYYDDHDGNVDNETWMADRENATLENVIHFVSRVGTFVIGSDDSSTGPMLMGMIVLGAMLGASVGTGVGIVGGSVLAMAGLSGVIAIDLAPSWFYAVALFGVGILLAASIRRSVS